MQHPSKEKQSRKQHMKKNAKAVLIIGMAVLVLFVMAFMAYVLNFDLRVPDRQEGQIATQLTATPTSEAPTTEPPTTQPPTTQAPTTEASTEPPLESHIEQAMALMETMTLEEKVWQLLFLTPDELTDTTTPIYAGEGTKEAIGLYPVGGVIYFGSNIQSEDQIRQMIENTQAGSKIPLFIGVDEEGGTVSRLSGIGVTDRVSSMATYGAAGNTEAVYELGQTLAEQIASVGFNIDFAPVADIVTNPNNTEIGSRAFSEDPFVAAQMVAQMVKGLQDGGMISCLKHFPGHGSTSADSHYGMSVTERTLEEMRQAEFLPFSAGIDAGAELVMISHMSAPNITGDNTPCDLSYTVVTELLREELGFEGVIISDSHEMASITSYYECGEAAVLAIQAGCDIVLMPTDKEKAFEAIMQAIEDGELTEERVNESVLRILSLKYEYGMIPE